MGVASSKWVQLSSVGTFTRRVDPLGVNIPDGWTLVRSCGCDGCFGEDHFIHFRQSYCTKLRYNKLDSFYMIFILSQSLILNNGEIGSPGLSVLT